MHRMCRYRVKHANSRRVDEVSAPSRATMVSGKRHGQPDRGAPASVDLADRVTRPRARSPAPPRSQARPRSGQGGRSTTPARPDACSHRLAGLPVPPQEPRPRRWTLSPTTGGRQAEPGRSPRAVAGQRSPARYPPASRSRTVPHRKRYDYHLAFGRRLTPRISPRRGRPCERLRRGGGLRPCRRARSFPSR